MRELTATRSDTGSHNRLDLIHSLVPIHYVCNGYVLQNRRSMKPQKRFQNVRMNYSKQKESEKTDKVYSEVYIIQPYPLNHCQFKLKLSCPFRNIFFEFMQILSDYAYLAYLDNKFIQQPFLKPHEQFE